MACWMPSAGRFRGPQTPDRLPAVSSSRSRIGHRPRETRLPGGSVRQDGFHVLAQLGCGKWLTNYAMPAEDILSRDRHAADRHALDRRLTAVGSHKHDRHMRYQAVEPCSQFGTVHQWHFDVGQHKMNRTVRLRAKL